MRTNIEIDESLITDAMRISKSKTKKETVMKALTAYINLLKRRDILKLKGRINWQGDLDDLRAV